MKKSNRSASKATTQKAIADELGVSVMTVSRALRDHPDLSDETKSRIVSRAIELGYKKIPAQSSKSTIKRVGLFHYDEVGMHQGLEALGGGVQKMLFFAIEEQCQRHQIEVVLQFPKTGEAPVAIKNKTIDAAFLLGRYTADDAAFFKDLPTLAISSFTAGSKIPSIVADNVEGARLATEHLIQLGHRNILFLSKELGAFTELFRSRSNGYTLAMVQNGLKPQWLFIRTEEELVPALPEIRKSTAVVCGADADASILKNTLTEAGLSVPCDMSITGFDNLNEEFTSYAPDWAQLGKMAVNMVVHSSELLGTQFKVTIPGRLIIRDSTTKPRVS